MRFIASLLLALLPLTACASLNWAQNQILYEADQGDLFLASAQSMGISVSSEDYFNAKRIWPRLYGEHIKRRALILALGPDRSQFQRLHESYSSTTELEVLNELLVSARPEKFVRSN